MQGFNELRKKQQQNQNKGRLCVDDGDDDEVQTQTDINIQSLEEAEITWLKNKLQVTKQAAFTAGHSQLSFQAFQHSDVKISYYTGLPNLEVFSAVL